MKMQTLAETSETRELVRWELERANQHIVCAIEAVPSESAFDIAMVPLWNERLTARESFATPAGAFQRYAAIVAGLRDAGWSVCAYTA